MSKLKQNKERNLFSVKSIKRKPSYKSTNQRKVAKKKEKLLNPTLKDEQKLLKEFSKLDFLSYETITEGQCILGCIVDIYKCEMRISLPYRLVGYVSISNVSTAYKNVLLRMSDQKSAECSLPSLAELFRVGQILMTKVVSLTALKTGKVKINLSVMPEHVNSGLGASGITKGGVLQGAVSDVTDKGYVIDTGLGAVRAAFLPRKNTFSEGSIEVGSVLMCAVKKVLEVDGENSRGEARVKLTADTTFMAEHYVGRKGKNSSRALVPGSWVAAVVLEVNKDCLVLSIGECKAFVSPSHLPSCLSKLTDYSPGNEVMARVLYIGGLDNVVHCTLLDNLLLKNVLIDEDSPVFKVGDVVTGCEVIKTSPKEIFLRLRHPDGGEPTLAVSSVAKSAAINSGSAKNVAKRYAVGSVHSGTVVHVALMDQSVILSLEKKLLFDTSREVELEVGLRVRVKIVEYLSNGGALVSVGSPRVEGFVPASHLTNIAVKSSESKYAVGHTVNARVLKHLPGTRLHFTLKKDLVKTKLPIFKEFDSNFVGTRTLGVIQEISAAGVFVEFFGNMVGFLPSRNLPAGYTDALRPGSAIECVVASMASPSQITLSAAEINPVLGKGVGQTVDCVVDSKLEGGISVKVDGMPGQEMSIPMIHLHDDVQYAEAIWRIIKVGDVIKRAVVYKKEETGILLSVKASLFRDVCSKRFKIKFRDKDLVPAVVTECAAQSVTVRCLKGGDGQTHVLHKKHVFDVIPRDLNHTGLHAGQVLYVKCLQMDKEAKTLILDSNLKSVMKSKQVSSFQLLYDNLNAERLILNSLKPMLGNKYSGLSPGSKHIGIVKMLFKVGALISIPSLKLDGILLSDFYPKSQISLKQRIQVTILRFNSKHFCLELFAQPDVEVSMPAEPKIKLGELCVCEPILCRREFILAKLKLPHEGQLVYLPSQRHMNDLHARYPFYETGREYKMKVKFIENELVLADLLDHCDQNNGALNLSHERPELIFQPEPTTPRALESFALDERSLTKHDFTLKAKSKVYEISQLLDTKSECVDSLEKYNALKQDSFNQYWGVLYKHRFKEEEMQRKRLAKLGLKPRNRNSECKRKLEDAESPHSSQIKKNKINIQANKTQRMTKNFETAAESRINENKIKSDKRCDKIAESHSRGIEPSAIVEKYSDSCIEDELNTIEIVSPHRDKLARDSLGESPAKLDSTYKPTSNATPCLGKIVRPKEFKADEEKSKSCLSVHSNVFDWSGKSLQAEQSSSEDTSSSEDEENNKDKESKSVKRLSKFERRQLRRAEELRTRQLELQRVSEDQRPVTALDFEEKIERAPHTASVWIQYISFHLENAETEKSRAVASRGLSVIPAVMEEERLALWNVALKLEVMYGSPESVEASFKEALVTNDELKVYNIMLDIYANANKYNDAENLLKVMTKKFSQNKEVWTRAGLFFFHSNNLREARSALERSLISLPKPDHVDVIHKFAQMEMKHGDPERAKTVYETLLSNCPRRTDVWNTYADLLVKSKDINAARDVLERMVGLKLRINTMRNAFKKLLEFEQTHGTPQRVEAVKARVEEYVASALKNS